MIQEAREAGFGIYPFIYLKSIHSFFLTTIGPVMHVMNAITQRTALLGI